MSSVAGLHATAGHAIYNAAKFGVIGFSKSMALELGPSGIRVNVVAPGSIRTPTNNSVRQGEEEVARTEQTIALRRIGTVEEVANVVVFLFSRESSYVNGSVFEVSGGV
jgi:NAD(P)-dependent dehydrogenase (short-subunit alcohol dehydrogenase family)